VSQLGLWQRQIIIFSKVLAQTKVVNCNTQYYSVVNYLIFREIAFVGANSCSPLTINVVVKVPDMSLAI
jgi:hypothetical protein